MAKRHLADSTLFFARRFRSSRDARSDRPQIVYGLLCDRQGRPIAIEVFAGDVVDPATLSTQIAKLKQRFGLARVALVGDHSMIATARIGADLKRAGLDWKTTLRWPWI